MLKTYHNKGFTLIELVVVVVILAIIAAIAVPSYQHFIRKNRATQAQQEMQQIALELGNYKARNFNYTNFTISGTNPASKEKKIATNTQYPYTINVVIIDNINGNAGGQTWAITAQTSDAQNYNLLMTSTGLRCKSKNSLNGTTSCGSDSENW